MKVFNNIPYIFGCGLGSVFCLAFLPGTTLSSTGISFAVSVLVFGEILARTGLIKS